MNFLKKWLPSIFMVGASAIFLLLTLRGLGPTGTGVGAMLNMQKAWKSAPALHATGIIVDSSHSPGKTTHFELWEAGGSRRVRLSSSVGPGLPDHTILFVITPAHAWKLDEGDHKVQEIDPARVDLNPLPDPDSENSFYHFARKWTLLPNAADGHSTPSQRVQGTTDRATFMFSLDPVTHLPRSAAITATGPAPETGRAEFRTMEILPGLPAALFERPASQK